MYMVEEFKTINLAIELAGLVLCLLGNVLTVINGTLNKQTKRYFVLFFTCLMSETVCNMAGQLMRGLPGSAYRMALYASNFGEFLFGFLLPFIGTRLLLTIIDRSHKWKKIKMFIWIYLFVSITLLIISQFTGLFYIIDADNVYHRTSTYFISYVLGEMVVFVDVAVIIKYRSCLSKRETIAFGVYFIVPIIVGFAQIFIYGIYITLFSEIFSALILFVFILLEQTEQYYLKEQELKEMRMEVMLTQIQPHFLYNTLDGIYYLCDIDPKTAQKAVLDFSDYLRANMSSIDGPRRITFSMEMEHIEAYLRLRKLLLRDALNIVLEIETCGFIVPPLSIEPIVENAVKHGIGKKVGGGTVVIKTHEEKDAYVITIKDDGIGFDTEVMPNDGKRHIGISSVRQRLKNECGGTLEITSKIGEGTCAVIKIPRSGENDNIRNR